MFLNKFCLIIDHCETVLTLYKQSKNVKIFLTKKQNYYFVPIVLKVDDTFD